jgi:hypothetical protein
MATSIDKINALTEKYGLSNTVKEAIIEISKDAYITGSNNTSKALKEHQEGVNRIVKLQLEKVIKEWLS